MMMDVTVTVRVAEQDVVSVWHLHYSIWCAYFSA